MPTCAGCGFAVKFQSPRRLNAKQVIANVYKRGVWNRVEHYHFDCYQAAGCPYGDAAA